MSLDINKLFNSVLSGEPESCDVMLGQPPDQIGCHPYVKDAAVAGEDVDAVFLGHVGRDAPSRAPLANAPAQIPFGSLTRSGQALGSGLRPSLGMTAVVRPLGSARDDWSLA